MKLLFISLLPFYPDMAGGTQMTHLSLIRLLYQRGWQIEVISGISRRSPYYRVLSGARLRARFQLKRLPCYVRDYDLGYPCWRGIRSHHPIKSYIYKALRILGYRPSMTGIFRGCVTSGENVFTPRELKGAREWLDRRLKAFRPDVVLGHHGVISLLSHAARKGCLSVYYFHGLGRRAGTAVCQIFPDEIHLIANSPYTASFAGEASSHDVGIVLPPVIPADYRIAESPVKKRGRTYITFINPLPVKGLDVAVEVARQLPQERFLFAKGGWFEFSRLNVLNPLVRTMHSLPNVEVWDFQQDMRQVYAVTDILLVPSQKETFGRVILEAHINGIPVVASKVDGIAYTLGRGGVLVDPKDGPRAFVQILRRLRGDNEYYDALSALAFQNSLRPEFDPHRQADNFIRFVETHLQEPIGSR
jgi:glycosyltransferase involved in cell wall biosynthesis